MKYLSSQSLALLVTAGALFAVSQPLSASDADEAIVTAAKNSHVFTTFLKDDHIATDSKDGKVTLTGTVAEASHKSLAGDTVANLPGVATVDNQLTITAPAATTDNSDWWLSLKVRGVLMFHRNVNVAATGVNSVNGVVTLTGEASSLAQKELTTEYAQDVDGVKSVQNNMTVAVDNAPAVREQTAVEKLDDASITAQIKAALLTHRSTNAITTSVHTTDGVVTVGGIAKNASEKSLVTKLVDDIHGVNKVVNDMTIPYAATTSPK